MHGAHSNINSLNKSTTNNALVLCLISWLVGLFYTGKKSHEASIIVHSDSCDFFPRKDVVNSLRENIAIYCLSNVYTERDFPSANRECERMDPHGQDHPTSTVH